MGAGAPRTLLCVREVRWNSALPVSTLRLAQALSKRGDRIAWVLPPLMPWHTQRRGDLAALHDKGGQYVDDRVFEYAPRSWLPFSRRTPLDSPWLCEHTWQACVPSLPRVLKAHGLVPDVLLLSGYATAGVRRLFPGVRTVFHVTDDYAAFPTAPKTVRRIEAEAYPQGDLVITTTQGLAEQVQELGVPAHRVRVLHHGVDLAAYSTTPVEDPLGTLPHPRVVYLGNTSKLDLDVCERLLSLELQLVIAGPLTQRVRDWGRSRGVQLLGEVAPTQVPALLRHCDVGLIAYTPELRATAHMHPMKLYEYAAAGLPIVSSPLPGVDVPELCVLNYADPNSAAPLVERALKERAPMGAQNRSAVAGASWAARARTLDGWLRELLD